MMIMGFNLVTVKKVPFPKQSNVNVVFFVVVSFAVWGLLFLSERQLLNLPYGFELDWGLFFYIYRIVQRNCEKETRWTGIAKK